MNQMWLNVTMSFNMDCCIWCGVTGSYREGQDHQAWCPHVEERGGPAQLWQHQYSWFPHHHLRCGVSSDAAGSTAERRWEGRDVCVHIQEVAESRTCIGHYSRIASALSLSWFHRKLERIIRLSLIGYNKMWQNICKSFMGRGYKLCLSSGVGLWRAPRALLNLRFHVKSKPSGSHSWSSGATVYTIWWNMNIYEICSVVASKELQWEPLE